MSATPSRRRMNGVVGLLLVVTAIAAALAVASYLRSSEPPALIQSTLHFPAEMSAAVSQTNDPMVLSPDGRSLAFTSYDSNGRKLLWLRPLGQLEARPLPATDNARHPFWSADSQTLFFFSGDKLKRVPLDGSPPVTLCEVASNPIGGTANQEGIVLFSPASGAPLHQVAFSGGSSTAITTLDTAAGETTHRWPRFLPDGKSFLYVAASHDQPENSEVNAIYAAKLGSNDRKLILRARSNVEYVDGYLFFVRDKTLYAQEFDTGRLQVKGSPAAIATEVYQETQSFISAFSISESGTLVYASAGKPIKRQLVWLNREGEQTGVVIADSDAFVQGALSPDRKTIAMTASDPTVGYDLWLQDLSRGSLTRLTLGGSASQAVWSPDGKRLAYLGDKNHIYARDVEGATEPELLLDNTHWGGPVSWAPDGQTLAFWQFNPTSANGYDALLLKLDGTRTVMPIAATRAAEFPLEFSPDGRWLLYASDATGRPEVYLVSMPAMEIRKQLSQSGSNNAIWAGPNEIWYRQSGGVWVSVTLQTGPKPTPEFSPPRTLFTDKEIFSVSPIDSDRLFAVRDTGGDTSAPIVLVNDWRQLLASARR